VNFVIYGQARTGSTLLVRLLQSHPQIQCDSEIFNKDGWQRGVRRYLHPLAFRIPEVYALWKSCRCTKPVYSFKLLNSQVIAPGRLISYLHHHGWQIIHIQRRNLFGVAISRKVARQTKHWGEYKPHSHMDDLRLEFTVDEFYTQLGNCVNILHKEALALAGIPHISVLYEDDLLNEADRQRVCSTIFAALQISSHSVSTKAQRSWNRPYSELVTNYTELQALMESSRGHALQAEWAQLIDHG
jgi:LPS sulfotransferase NodH